MKKLCTIQPEPKTQHALDSISSHLLIKSTELLDSIKTHKMDQRAALVESMIDHLADVIESMASLNEHKLIRALNKVTEDVAITTNELCL